MSNSAMSTAISGLRNQQTAMDVIANNIANADTSGFKSSRVTFEESFAVLLQGASRPPGDQGGVNPLQIGSGSSIGSIDSIMSQGTIESTGNDTDLAIEGDGFFVLSDGTSDYYTRSGSFQWDSNGTLVNPTNGMKVQGRIADSTGEVNEGSAIGDIIISYGTVDPAKATSAVSFTGNLDSSDDPTGNILQAATIYARENSGETTDMNGLYANGAADAQITGLSSNSTTVTVTGTATGVDSQTMTYTYVADDTGTNSDFHTLDDLIEEINNDFGGYFTASLTSEGAIQFTSTDSTATVTLSSVNSVLNTALAAANGQLDTATSTDEFSHVANADDALVDLRNSVGEDLGLSVSSVITVDASVGGEDIETASIEVDDGTGNSITYGTFVQNLKDAFGITNSSGVSIDETTGATVINADGGTANEISALDISATGVAAFNDIYDATVGNWTETQESEDVTHSASVRVYDSLGNSHNLTITFTRDVTVDNGWTWSISVPEPAEISGGYTGTIAFDANGNLKSYTYSQGASSFTFDPKNGADVPVEIAFDFGTVGTSGGVYQYADTSTVIADEQDGYTSGTLDSVTIGGDGTITGEFTNGNSRVMARLILATFNNAAGLLRVGDNTYTTSANSGGAIIGFAGSSINATITPGALEASNVDIAEQFTSMIVAQRTFQANARTITTSDALMEETVNLKR